MIEKSPLTPDKLEYSPIDTRNIRSACNDYIKIETEAAKRENIKHYAKPLYSRLRTGESVLVKVTDIDGVFESQESVTITGELVYDNLEFDDTNEVKSSIRVRGRSDTSSGSFMHAVPLNGRNDDIDSSYENPHTRYRAPMVTVESIDLNTNEIVLKYLDLPSHADDPYVKFQHSFTSGQPENKFSIQLTEGDGLLLEPGYNNFTAQKAVTAMTAGYNNSTVNVYDSLIDSTSDNSTTAFDITVMDEFAEWLDVSSSLLSPNDSQRAFITDGEQELVPLQGPPGTGKTSGALAPGIISRILSHRTPHTWGLVTGPSHKATNETLESVIDIIDAYQASARTDDALDDIQVYRLAEQPEDDTYIDSDYLTYDSLYMDAGTDVVLANGISQSDRDNPVLVFTTPGKAWKLGQQMMDHTTPSGGDYDERIEDAERQGLFNVFDIYAADEASMLTLPQFFMAGAQYQGNGAILISGDHRQLPPVQKHNWDTEFRPSIRSVAPFLSTLDFTRLLTEKPSEVLDPDLADLLHDDLNRDKTGVSFHRLQESYRNHTQLAEFLRETVYEQDGIPYQSSQTDTISTPQSNTQGIGMVTSPDEPVVLVTYDDTSSQQSNPTEAVITGEILDVIREDSIGVVTPHNAQRALLHSVFDSAYPGVSNRDPDVATVNRFQGGERDVIVMNGTVSDPDYIDAESRFLLNLNRINVALSRMREKLVVVVAESVFSYIPADTHEYEETTVWKNLARVSGYADPSTDPVWNGSLEEFIGKPPARINSHVSSDTNVSVYYVKP